MRRCSRDELRRLTCTTSLGRKSAPSHSFWHSRRQALRAQDTFQCLRPNAIATSALVNLFRVYPVFAAKPPRIVTRTMLSRFADSSMSLGQWHAFLLHVPHLIRIQRLYHRLKLDSYGQRDERAHVLLPEEHEVVQHDHVILMTYNSPATPDFFLASCSSAMPFSQAAIRNPARATCSTTTEPTLLKYVSLNSFPTIA